MGELEDKLNHILKDEAAMGQIMSLARALSGGKSEEGDKEQARDAKYVPTEMQQSVDNPFAMLENLDPRMLQLGMRVLSEYNRTDDRKLALLMALRPFVKEERHASVDRAVQIARLSRVIMVAFEALREGRTQDGGEGA